MAWPRLPARSADRSAATVGAADTTRAGVATTASDNPAVDAEAMSFFRKRSWLDRLLDGCPLTPEIASELAYIAMKVKHQRSADWNDVEDCFADANSFEIKRLRQLLAHRLDVRLAEVRERKRLLTVRDGAPRHSYVDDRPLRIGVRPGGALVDLNQVEDDASRAHARERTAASSSAARQQWVADRAADMAETDAHAAAELQTAVHRTP